jgi:hypothetical protein
MLFASYRKADYADPDGFVASMAIVLAQYPEEVVLYVTRPETGIQRRIKFPPTIPEVVEACDARVSELKTQERFKNWGSRNDPPADDNRAERSSIEELRARYGENWGLDVEDRPKPSQIERKAPTPEEIKAHYDKHGFGFKLKPVRPPLEDEA